MIREALWTWLIGAIPTGNPADQDIARQAYADYLMAQVSGFLPEKHPLNAELEKARTSLAEDADPRTSFATLMGVETRLVDALSEKQVERNYWAARDRFNRVAAAQGIAEHERWSPPELKEPAFAAATPLTMAGSAQTAALVQAGRAAVALAVATAAVQTAGTAATDEQKAACAAAQASNDAAIAAVKAADQNLAALLAALSPNASPETPQEEK